MNGSGRVMAALGATLVAVGLVTAALPPRFIEDRFGFEPDAGSGALELLIVLVLLAGGATLLVRSAAVTRLGRRAAHVRRDPAGA